jgi:hypothetical protein
MALDGTLSAAAHTLHILCELWPMIAHYEQNASF